MNIFMNEGTSSSSLPYEITNKKEQKTDSEKYTVMKRVEASIAAEKNRQNGICVRRFKLTGNIL